MQTTSLCGEIKTGGCGPVWHLGPNTYHLDPPIILPNAARLRCRCRRRRTRRLAHGSEPRPRRPPHPPARGAPPRRHSLTLLRPHQPTYAARSRNRRRRDHSPHNRGLRSYCRWQRSRGWRRQDSCRRHRPRPLGRNARRAGASCRRRPRTRSPHQCRTRKRPRPTAYSDRRPRFRFHRPRRCGRGRRSLARRSQPRTARPGRESILPGHRGPLESPPRGFRPRLRRPRARTRLVRLDHPDGRGRRPRRYRLQQRRETDCLLPPPHTALPSPVRRHRVLPPLRWHDPSRFRAAVLRRQRPSCRRCRRPGETVLGRRYLPRPRRRSPRLRRSPPSLRERRLHRRRNCPIRARLEARNRPRAPPQLAYPPLRPRPQRQRGRARSPRAAQRRPSAASLPPRRYRLPVSRASAACSLAPGPGASRLDHPPPPVRDLEPPPRQPPFPSVATFVGPIPAIAFDPALTPKGARCYNRSIVAATGQAQTSPSGHAAILPYAGFSLRAVAFILDLAVMASFFLLFFAVAFLPAALGSDSKLSGTEEK